MRGPSYSEPVEFWGVPNPIPDGIGGFVGEPVKIHGCLATVKPLPSKRDDTGQGFSIKQQYSLTFWLNPAYEPREGHTVRWRTEKLTVQLVDYTDQTRKQYRVIAIEE